MAVLSFPRSIRSPIRSRFKTKGSETGTAEIYQRSNLTVMVLPQASGRGTVEVDTDGDVHAGDTGR